VSQQRRDIDGLIATVKKNTNLTSTQRTRQLQQLLGEKRQQLDRAEFDREHAAPASRDPSKMYEADGVTPTKKKKKRSRSSTTDWGKGKTSVPGVDAVMKKLGIY
jgi:hypothetical protein